MSTKTSLLVAVVFAAASFVLPASFLVAGDLYQPISVTQMSLGEKGFLASEPSQEATESPSDARLQAPTEKTVAPEPVCCQGSAHRVCCRCAACDQPWTLPQPCFLQCRGIKVGGWLEQGITTNSQGPTRRYNGPVSTNDRDGEWQINQLWFYLDRQTDGSAGLDIGGHVDMIWGTDWRFGIANGLETNINSFDQPYGWVIPQMFAEIAYGRMKVRGGRFAGLLYYDRDQVPAVTNFFYSHSYTMAYGEPQLVTGMMVDYALTDQWLLQAGFTQGWYMWEDLNDYKDFMGAITWNSPDKRTKFKWAITNGRQDHLGQVNTKNWFAYDVWIQHQFTERFTYAIQHNLGVADDALPLTGQDADWYTLNQYLFYKINPKWEAGARFEWFRDDDGARVAGPGTNPDYAGLRSWDGYGFAGNFYEISLGLNWCPHPNLRVRPEARWDWYEGQRSWGTNDLPFGNGDANDQFTFGCDFLLTY